MIICGKCGMSNQDDNQFCIGCGQKIESEQPSVPSEATVPASENEPIEAPAAPPVMTAPPISSVPPMQQVPGYMREPMPYTYGQPAGSFGFTPIQPNIGALQNIRDLIASNMMLTLVILWFVSIGLSIVTIAFGTAGLTEALSQSGLNESQIGSFGSVFSYSAGFTEILPTLLIGIGLLMAYRSAGNRSSAMSTGGITMIKVISIIQFVFVCIILAVMLLLSVAALAGSANGSLDNILGQLGNDVSDSLSVSGVIGVLGGVFLVIVLIGGALSITFFTVLMKFLGSIVSSIRTGIPQEKCASAFSVLMYIVGVFLALSIFGSFASMAVDPSQGLLQLASSAVQTAIYFIMGTLAKKYKQAVYTVIR